MSRNPNPLVRGTDPDPDPDLDTYKNVKDPQHGFAGSALWKERESM
jgi:hypothetical protein